MYWFNGARPLDQNGVVYDIFTVSKPKQQQQHKKHFRPKSVQRQTSIHDLHTEYDRTAKKLLKPVTKGLFVYQGLQFIDDQALDKSYELVKEYYEQMRIESIEASIICASRCYEQRKELGQVSDGFLALHSANGIQVAGAFAVALKFDDPTGYQEKDLSLRSESAYGYEAHLFEYSISDLVDYDVYGAFWASEYYQYYSQATRKCEADGRESGVIVYKHGPCEVYIQQPDKKPFRKFVEIPASPENIFQVYSAFRNINLLLVGNENLNYTFRYAVCGFNLAHKEFVISLEINDHFRVECDIYWYQQTYVQTEVFEALRAGYYVNHFSKVAEIVDKGSFFKKMRALAFVNQRFAKIVVQTYLVPNYLHNLLQDNYGKNNVYIIKPANLSRGRGIFLTRDPMSFTDCKSIVQIYMPNPLLHYGRKIDFRIYVLVSNDHGYLYCDGLVRQAQKPFTMSSLENEVHLTNTSLNGSKCKLRISAYLEGVYNRELIIQGLKLAAQAVERLAVKIASPKCFELLGCDVLLSATHEPFLLEINSSPNLVYSCSADQVKVELLQDVFGLLLLRKTDNWIVL